MPRHYRILWYQARQYAPIPELAFEVSPQHFNPPVPLRAQVCPPPALIAATPLLRPTTFTGTVRFLMLPFPRCPK